MEHICKRKRKIDPNLSRKEVVIKREVFFFFSLEWNYGVSRKSLRLNESDERTKIGQYLKTFSQLLKLPHFPGNHIPGVER